MKNIEFKLSKLLTHLWMLFKKGKFKTAEWHTKINGDVIPRLAKLIKKVKFPIKYNFVYSNIV